MDNESQWELLLLCLGQKEKEKKEKEKEKLSYTTSLRLLSKTLPQSWLMTTVQFYLIDLPYPKFCIRQHNKLLKSESCEMSIPLRSDFPLLLSALFCPDSPFYPCCKSCEVLVTTFAMGRNRLEAPQTTQSF